jgi:quercetin dioxygenase-like cupin family protein
MSFYTKSITYITLLVVGGLVLPVAKAAEAKVSKKTTKISIESTENPSSTRSSMLETASMPETTDTLTPAASVADATSSQSQMTLFTPDTIEWMPGSNHLPVGSKIAVLEGDPNKEGPFTIRVKFPANYMNAPHTHPKAEHMTVISGSFNLGVGQKFDSTNGKEMPAGSFVLIPAGVPHYGWGTEETVLQIHGMGPREKILINATDNLSNNPATAVKPPIVKSSD